MSSFIFGLVGLNSNDGALGFSFISNLIAFSYIRSLLFAQQLEDGNDVVILSVLINYN